MTHEVTNPRTVACVQELDGLLLVIDPSRPEQERELETFYRNFAEPNNLYTRQCMVMAIQVQKEGGGLGGWQGKSGQLGTGPVVVQAAVSRGCCRKGLAGLPR